MKWITSTDLEQWADRRDSTDKLPELIRRLIIASIDRIEKIRFPSGESVTRPGWDGCLQCLEGSPPFVPAGYSVWELTTEKNVADKVWRDFRKRSGPGGRPLPEGFEQSKTTYVAVSLRRWSEPKKKKENSREGFIEDAKSKGPWADVKVLDADDLELWLEQSPSVAAWLNTFAYIGRIPSTVLCSDIVWNAWRHRSDPPVNERLLLIERDNEIKSLIESLVGDPKIIHIKADSPDEAQAFLIAAIQGLPIDNPTKLDILSRTIIVKDGQTAFQLPSGEKSRLIIIVHDDAKKHAGGLLERKHTIVVPLGNADRGKQPEIVIKRQSRKAFAKGLESLGLQPETAEIQARQCSCSVTVFQRRNPSSTIEPPAWASDEKIRLLIPAILAGAWNEKSGADQEIINRLSGRSYVEYIEILQPFFRSMIPQLLVQEMY
jgi:hypothetical protein